MNNVHHLIYTVLLSLIVMPTSFSQSTFDPKYSLGGYFDFNMMQSSIDSEGTNHLYTDLEFGRFKSPKVLIGITWNYDGIKFSNSDNYIDWTWILSGFYRKKFNKSFVRMDIGYGSNRYKYPKKYPVKRHIFSLSMGAGIIIDVNDHIKIPLSIDYSVRVKFYSFLEQEKKNQYFHYLPIKIGINYYFHSF